MKEYIEKLIIEMLSQDENGVEKTPKGNALIEKIKENKHFLKIYKDYKNNEKI